MRTICCVLPTIVKSRWRYTLETAYQSRRPTTGTLAMTADQRQFPNEIRPVNDIRTSKAIRKRAAPWSWDLDEGHKSLFGVSIQSELSAFQTEDPRTSGRHSRLSLRRVCLCQLAKTDYQNLCTGINAFTEFFFSFFLSSFHNIEQRKKIQTFLQKRSYEVAPFGQSMKYGNRQRKWRLSKQDDLGCSVSLLLFGTGDWDCNDWPYML